jgi:hypothetical protein
LADASLEIEKPLDLLPDSDPRQNIKYFHHIAAVNFDGGPCLIAGLIFFSNLKARLIKNVIETIGVLFLSTGVAVEWHAMGIVAPKTILS